MNLKGYFSSYWKPTWDNASKNTTLKYAYPKLRPSLFYYSCITFKQCSGSSVAKRLNLAQRSRT